MSIEEFVFECICVPEPTGSQMHSPACVFSNRMRAEAMVDEGDDAPLIATVPDGAVRPWRQIVKTHPKEGRPGITYERVDPGVQWGGGPDGGRIHTLVHRNHRGRMTGVLYYYPVDFVDAAGRKIQRGGTVHLWVDPARWGRGIGTALAVEGNRRWPDVDLAGFDFTEGGLALAKKIAALRRSGAVTTGQ